MCRTCAVSVYTQADSRSRLCTTGQNPGGPSAHPLRGCRGGCAVRQALVHPLPGAAADTVVPAGDVDRAPGQGSAAGQRRPAEGHGGSEGPDAPARRARAMIYGQARSRSVLMGLRQPPGKISLSSVHRRVRVRTRAPLAEHQLESDCAATRLTSDQWRGTGGRSRCNPRRTIQPCARLRTSASFLDQRDLTQNRLSASRIIPLVINGNRRPRHAEERTDS
jgi:hypothetical protein